MLGDAYDLGVLTGFGFALWVLLMGFWIVVLARTSIGAYTGALLKAPPQPPPPPPPTERTASRAPS